MHRSQPDRRMLKTYAMQTERSLFRWLLEPLKSARTPFPRKPPDSPSMLLTGNTQGRNSQGRSDMRRIFQGRIEDRPAGRPPSLRAKSSMASDSSEMKSRRSGRNASAFSKITQDFGRSYADKLQIRRKSDSPKTFPPSSSARARWGGIHPIWPHHQTREPLSIRASAMRMQAPIKPAMR